MGIKQEDLRIFEYLYKNIINLDRTGFLSTLVPSKFSNNTELFILHLQSYYEASRSEVLDFILFIFIFHIILGKIDLVETYHGINLSSLFRLIYPYFSLISSQISSEQ